MKNDGLWGALILKDSYNLLVGISIMNLHRLAVLFSQTDMGPEGLLLGSPTFFPCPKKVKTCLAQGPNPRLSSQLINDL